MNTTKLDRNRLLWRTRGANWDYMFLCSPTSIPCSSWFNKYRLIFRDREPQQSPAYSKGTLCIESSDGSVGYFPFVACLGYDPLRKDWTQRPIQHYFVYFPDSTSPPNNADWFNILLNGFCDAYEPINQLDGSLVAKLSQADIIDRFAKATALPIDVESLGTIRSEKIDDLGEIRVVEKKKPAHASPVSIPWTLVVGGLAMGALMLLIARSCLSSNHEPPATIDSATAPELLVDLSAPAPEHLDLRLLNPLSPDLASVILPVVQDMMRSPLDATISVTPPASAATPPITLNPPNRMPMPQKPALLAPLPTLPASKP